MNRLLDMIKRHEGSGPIKNGRFMPYTDSVGKLTIGWGRNISDRGLRAKEVYTMLVADVDEIVGELEDRYQWFILLDTTRRAAVIDMAFNLGITRFHGFKKFRMAMVIKDWTHAKKEMLDSKWARQVGPRAIELSDMILTGEFKK